MRTLVNQWHNISVYLAGAVGLAAILVPGDLLLKLQLASIMVMFIHFFEEFGYPGGFPLMGVRVMLGSDERDSTKWDCNNLNSMFGNWLALLLIWIAPVVFRDVRWLVLAGMLFNVMEVVMHLLLFNVRQRSLYNPGLVSAVFGLGPIAVVYFTQLFDASALLWYDWVIAIVWMVGVFAFCFRSPLYWRLGRKEGYPLTDQTAYGVGGAK